MSTNNVMAEVFALVLSAPGMGNVARVTLNISSKNLLLLNFLIEQGLSGQGTDKVFLENFPEESKKELKAIADDLLAKGDLQGVKEHLKKFSK